MMNEESLALSEVQAAFTDAKDKFEELSKAALDLQSVTSQLDDARSSVTDAAGRVGELADASIGVAEQLAETTRAIEAVDPARIHSRLEEIGKATDRYAADSATAIAEIAEANRRAELDNRKQRRLQLILNSVTLVAVIAVVVLLVVR